MVIYSGEEVEVRMATNTTDVTTATAIPYISTISFDFDQGLKEVPKGLGYGRQQEIHESLISTSGSITHTYDETEIDGSDAFSEMWGLGETGTLTEYVIEIKNTTSGPIWLLEGVRGKLSPGFPVDGFITDNVDFKFSTVTYTRT
jgi:hypothetical protein